MKLRIFVFLLFIIVVTMSKSHADSEATADAKDPSSVWMAYCASFLPCKMVVTQSDAHAAGANMIDRVKNYFSKFGKSPAMDASEFKQYLATLSANERQDFVKRCTLQRGDSGKDICENDYLLDGELQALHNKKITLNVRGKFEQLRDERDRLVREDNRLHEILIQICNKPELQCIIYSGDSFNKDILRLRREMDRLNKDPEFRDSFGMLESKAIAWTKVTQEFTDLSLVPKPPATASKAWDVLPSREDSQMQIVVNPTDKSEKSGFKDPYSNVSNQLSQEKINQEADSFSTVMNILLAVSDAVATNQSNVANANISGGPLLAPGNATASGSEICPLSEPYRSQCEARNAARRSGQATPPRKQAPQYHQPANENMYSPKFRKVPDATHCVRVNHDKYGYGELVNGCSYAIEIAWCSEGSMSFKCSNGTWGFGAVWTLSPGGKYPAGGKGAVHFAACGEANAPPKETGPGTYTCDQ